MVSTLQIVWPSFSGFAFASLCVWAFTYATLSERVSTVPRPAHHPACRQVSWAPPQVNSQPSCATVTQLTHRLVSPQVSQLPPSLASQLAFRPVPWTLRLPECRSVSASHYVCVSVSVSSSATASTSANVLSSVLSLACAIVSASVSISDLAFTFTTV